MTNLEFTAKKKNELEINLKSIVLKKIIIFEMYFLKKNLEYINFSQKIKL